MHQELRKVTTIGLVFCWAAALASCPRGAVAQSTADKQNSTPTKGRFLWTRTIGSTVVGEFFNTALFYTIALYGVLPTSLLVQSIMTGWVIKTGVEVVMTPVTYAVVAKMKKLENEDYYDADTNFNPFLFK